MSKPPVTTDDLKARAHRRDEWRDFRRDFLFTQARLADALGIDRRTVQKIEAAETTPLPVIREKFEQLKAAHKKGRAAKEPKGWAA